MSTILFTHPVCLEHENFPGHPEQPDRLRSILMALEDPAFFMLDRRDSPLADVAAIKRVHAPYYVEAVLESVPERGFHQLDPDTGLSPASGEAALRSVGGACAAVDAVLNGEARNALSAARPPGHHAEAAQAMGFCLFNNVAVAAQHARHQCGLKKVAVVDFDVHHGNGTQSAFEQNADLFYASSHQFPAYPGTGLEHETGVDNNIVNVPLSPGSGSAEFRDGYTSKILPELRRFEPELLLISAGFDAHARDPLAQLRLQTDDFVWVTQELLKVADECCKGRVVSVLEGGYDLPALGASVAAHLRELMGI
ncbi:MAG: histone deacetylase family protein [Rhodospirillales bacterium]|nr:histone deacetylase family protein [Rhodospirillales bacterium]